MSADPAARAALLRRLPRDGFVPPEADAPWSPAARAAAYAAEVEAFAAVFWMLTTTERLERYDRLRATGYGHAEAALAGLRIGLDAVLRTDAAGRPTARELARELYIIRLQARAKELSELRADAAAQPALRADVPFTSDRVPAYRTGPNGRSARWVARLTCLVVAILLPTGVWLVTSGAGADAERPRFTPDEVGAFHRYSELLREGKAPRVPPRGYSSWLSAGMPLGRGP